MPDLPLVTVLVAIGVGVIFLVFLVALIAKFYRQVDQGKALIVNTMGKEPIVTFTGRTVVPVINRAEVMDISVKTIEIARTGKDGLICADNIRADIKVTFFVRVNKTVEDVLKVAQTIGCVRASDPETLETLFSAKFSEALKTVGKRLDFEELYTKRHEFKDQILTVIGQDLNGYVLDDCAIDYLEQTPLSNLDPHNILDAHGIRKITQITAEQNILTNDLRREEEKKIKKKNTETAEATMELDRQQADAAYKQQREIASVKAREEAEAARIIAEERKKAELARIKVDEELGVNEENKRRQIEVAVKNRERVVLVEQERVVKDQQLEAIGRERETELKRIEKEKALEVQKKEIADVIRGRVAVDKTVAEEEERIKDLRVLAAARRAKDAKIIEAEAQAEQELVKQIKAAQAGEESAKFEAKQRLLLADADLEASDRVARAKMRMAEGTQAEAAAPGLAEVKVKEADAAAIEKLGGAEARVLLQKMESEARGRESQGLAEVKVREAQAAATEKTGNAEANARRQMLLAEAAGKEADAAATEKMATAKAAEIRESLLGEAAGLTEKAEAMKHLDDATRAHEEYRLRLDRQMQVALAQISARKDIAHAQAEVMSAAMGTAKINIVGGDGQFFDRFVHAVSLGQALDGVVDNSDTARKLVGGYLDGSESFTDDMKAILSRPAIDTEALKNLSVTAILTQLLGAAGEGERGKLQALVARAKELGL
ncbi:MAG: hypothetical protein IPH07_17475 [Deltaproteobacteria bacterium]|nr:hypothetical protein [Deltaproteobacteria bacterium]MBK8239561.1 hypothetical protein [Deltaproteobacteria bacterium]MBP7290071.1 hypothetical protein [Nannocystaceae bacterium]